MANPSGERLAEALRTIFDENMDATESFLSEKNESGLGIRSAGRSRVGKSMKGKTKSFQRYPAVPDECLEDLCDDDIFGSASLKGNDQSRAIHGNVGSDVNSHETKNSNLSLQAETADLSLAGNEDVQFATNLPPKDLPKKGKKFDSSFKTCSSTSIPPDEVVIEAMKLIFDENVDATRIFALDKKESTRLDSSSHGEDRVSGKVKIKAKQKRYRSVLDDLLDDDSDDIFGPAFAKTNKGAPVAEMKVAEGEVEQCKLIAEESVDSSHEFVPENTMISGKEDGGKTVDICFDSSDSSKLLLKQDSDAASDSVSSVASAQGLHCCSEVELNDSTMSRKDVEDQENVSDLKLSLCSVEQITGDEPYLASDHDTNLKVPFDGEVAFPGTEINDLPASQKVTEISLPNHDVIKNNVSSSSPNKRKQNGISNGYDELDNISSGSTSEEMEEVNPNKKRKHTGLALESELMRNVHAESENMLIKIPNFNFVSHTGSDQKFTGCQRDVEETAKDEEREEKFSHLRGIRSSKSKPCQPIFRFEDKEIETLFGSGRNKSMNSVETKSDRDVVKQAAETMISTKDIDLHNRISDPLLNTNESSDNEESHLNTDLQRSRKPERTENYREDLSSADAGVLLTRGLEPCSESAQNTKFTAEYPLQQIPLKSGQGGTCSFIFQLPSEYLPNAFLLCAAGILLVAVPSLLILVPVYILALFNAIFITCLLMVGAMVFMIYCGKEKKHVRNTITHGASMEHLQLPDIKYFKSPDDVFKGWMNELSGSYDASNFHISHLRSVYVSLDGRTLRLRTPKKRIPKRSVCSDTIPTPGSFIKQRFYDLSGSKVTTLPEGLVLRRLWSKKYPILIEIPVGQMHKGKPVVDHTGGCDEGTELESLNEKNYTRLFMFARTCREKEEWFRRLYAASSSSMLSSSCSDSVVKNTLLGTSIQPSVSEAKKDSPCESESPKLLTKSDDQNFSDYLSSMSKVLSLNNESVCDPQLLWINAFISRCTMDVLQESHWIEVIKRKLDKKLLTAKIPFFMDDVRLVEFDLGKEVPFICKATLPSLDDQGLWMDLEVTYGGRLSFTIETKCNLLKLKGMSPTDVPRVSRRSSAATNSDEEDSGESSTGDSSDNEEYNDPERQKPRVNWLLRLADRITSSRHFQNALKIDRIKKLMESVSSKSLMLSVEVHSIKGTLAVNIPPPPTDRIWYGFRHMPELEMSVEVQVGQRQIALTPLTSWIEKKLIVELERALVMPNMDDILFPLMCDHVTNAHLRTTGNSE